MPDIYEQALAFRAALLARDKAAMAQITQAYGIAYARLLRQLAAITNQIEEARRAGQEPSPAWLKRQERYNQLLRDIDVQFRAFGQTAFQRVQARVLLEGERAIRDAQSLIRTGTTQVSVQFDRLAPAAVEAIVGQVQEGTALASLFDEIAPLARGKAEEALVNAVVQGWNPRKTAVEFRRALGIPLNRALLISRTETIRAYREATRATYEANSDVVTGWRWTASKSIRTCLNCLSRDGRIYPLEKPLPQHPNCRCTLVPVIIGIPDDAQTGAEWFATLSPEQQRLMMGNRAHELYKDGSIVLKDFEGEKTSRKWGVSTYERSLREILAEK